MARQELGVAHARLELLAEAPHALLAGALDLYWTANERPSRRTRELR